MKWGEGQFGEQPFAEGLAPTIAGHCHATATGSAPLRRRLALRGALHARVTASAAIDIHTPLRSAHTRALRVMSGARVT